MADFDAIRDAVARSKRLTENEFGNYLIGGYLCNAFVLGEIGASDDFFIVGAPSTDVDSYPILTGNLLDAEGLPLFRLVQNVLMVNPRDCSKIRGEHIGFSIADGDGHHVLDVETTWDRESLRYVTTLRGTF